MWLECFMETLEVSQKVKRDVICRINASSFCALTCDRIWVNVHVGQLKSLYKGRERTTNSFIVVFRSVVSDGTHHCARSQTENKQQ